MRAEQLLAFEECSICIDLVIFYSQTSILYLILPSFEPFPRFDCSPGTRRNKCTSLRFQTDNRITADSERDAKHRVTRSDVRAALGNKLDPGFWPARGRRSDAAPYWANRGRSVRQRSQGLWPYWRPGILREDSELWHR